MCSPFLTEWFRAYGVGAAYALHTAPASPMCSPFLAEWFRAYGYATFATSC